MTTPKLPPPPLSAHNRSASSTGAGAGADDAPVGGHDLGRHEVVDAQAVASAKPSDAAAQGETGDTGVGDQAAWHRERERLRLAIDVAPDRAALDSRTSPFRVDPHTAHGRQIDHHAVVADGVAGDVVAAAADRGREPVLARERDGGHDVRRSPAAGYHGRMAIDHGVPDRAGAVVAIVSRDEHLAPWQRVPQRVESGLRNVGGGGREHVPILRLTGRGRFARGGHFRGNRRMAQVGYRVRLASLTLTRLPYRLMPLSPTEQRVVDAVGSRREAIVALTRELVAFDTVTHTPGAPPRQERALQEHLAALLSACGAEVALHEPDASALRPHPMVPEELTFEGRPQLVARMRGTGGGRTLLLNGHVDVVDVEPRADWTLADPFAASNATAGSTAAGRAT